MVRADKRLLDLGLASSIELARALIMEGRVLNGTNRINKPSDSVSNNAVLTIKGKENPYVSRGAHKLKRAFETFGLNVNRLNCIDIGSSTGGFTDVMLRSGAERVYSVDVGYNLLDWRLRSNPRVTCMERINARFLEKDMFPTAVDFGATDVSFISLKAILPSAARVLSAGANFVALIKPQFEAAKELVGEKGVVREKSTHISVVTDIIKFALDSGWNVEGLDFSPITGAEGNIEFLLLLKNKPECPSSFDFNTIDDVINDAYDKFIKS